MNILQSKEGQEGASHVPATPNTGEITARVQALMEQNVIADATDRMRVTEALAFIAAPTDNIDEIKHHASKIGEVLSGYWMLQQDPPAEVDALNWHMQHMACSRYIAIVRQGIAAGEHGETAVKDSMILALSLAKTYASANGDTTLLQQATELKEIMGQL